MNLTVDSGCTYITATTPDTNTLENWITGDLFNTQVSFFFNCNQVGSFYLPNQYPFDVNSVSTVCEEVIGGVSFTVLLTGITNAQIATTTITDNSTTVYSITPIDKVSFTVVMDTVFTNFIEFEILDTLGYIYKVRVDFGIYVLDPCDFTDDITILETPSLPCGIEFGEGYTLNIYNEYLRADCNFPCDTGCRKYCDGIYTVQIGDELSCIFMNCSTKCNVVDYFLCNGGDSMVLLEALTAGSELTSVGSTDCVTCDQLCEVFRKIQKLLGHTSKNILEDCGCNNN
jgi:hypothetical protein